MVLETQHVLVLIVKAIRNKNNLQILLGKHRREERSAVNFGCFPYQNLLRNRYDTNVDAQSDKNPVALP